MSLPCQVRTWTWIKSWQRQEVYQSLQTRPNTKDSFLKGNRIETAGEYKIKTHPMWTSQWWNLLLENRTLYSVSSVCLWWTISLQSPTGSIFFVIILWHLDTTQFWPRGVITKGSHLRFGQLGWTALVVTSAEGLVRLRPWWAQSLFSKVLSPGSIVRTGACGGRYALYSLFMVTVQINCGPGSHCFGKNHQ